MKYDFWMLPRRCRYNWTSSNSYIFLGYPSDDNDEQRDKNNSHNDAGIGIGIGIGMGLESKDITNNNYEADIEDDSYLTTEQRFKYKGNRYSNSPNTVNTANTIHQYFGDRLSQQHPHNSNLDGIGTASRKIMSEIEKRHHYR